MTKDEALRMAIERLEDWNNDELVGTRFYEEEMNSLIPLKEALEQPTQEPVAWMNDIAFSMEKDELTADKFGDIVPLYTHPKGMWRKLCL